MSFLQDNFQVPPVPKKRNKKLTRSSPLSSNSNGSELQTFATPSQTNNAKTSESSDDCYTRKKTETPSTLSKSYSEKINERFRNVRDKAGQSTKKAKTFKKVTESVLFAKVRKETDDVESQLQLMREQLKLDKTGYKEALDFFCEEVNKTEELEENEDPDIVREQNQAILKTSTGLYLGKKALDEESKIESENLRFLKDEGIFVEKAPKIPKRHIKILEQRLCVDNKKWFNCEGSLAFFENPYQKFSHRPPFQINLSEISYQPAKIEDSSFDEIVIIKENLLCLQLVSLQFIHHPLFSREHVLVEKLKTFYNEYEKSVEKNDLVRINKRLDGLRQIVRHCESEEDNTIVAYKRDIKILQEELFEQSKTHRNCIKTILQTWKSIKQLREANKYSNTNVNLVIKKEKVNYKTDQDEFDETFSTVYREYLEYENEQKDDDEIRRELLDRFKESFRAPGEPILHFALNNDNERTKNVQNQREIDRRNAVASTKITLKLTCNNAEVCKTKSLQLDDDFTCCLNENISMQLMSIPKHIKVEIIEQQKLLMKKTISEIILEVPTKNEKSQKVFFEKKETVHYKHEGVGSGEELNTSGCLDYSLNWSSLPNQTSTTNDITDKTGAIDNEKLTQWMSENKPDPQDPRNLILYEYYKNFTANKVTNASTNFFRLNHHTEKWQFCDPMVIESNLRLKLLQLRATNEAEFDRMVVPNRAKEIPFDILDSYKNRMDVKDLSPEDDDNEDDIEKNRKKGKKILQQVYIKIYQKCKNVKDNLSYEDVLDEKLLPQLQKLFKNIGIAFVSWFQWRPLFKPILTQPKLIYDSKLNNFEYQNQVKIVLHLINGLNIPVQSTNNTVKPFVEIECNDYKVRSSTSDGIHPSWNEKLFLPLDQQHLDYLNPNSLRGKINIKVYDENNDNLLNSLEVPLSAIQSSGGMFKLNQSQVMFGYELKPTQSNILHTYLNLDIMIEPNVPKLNPTIEELPCSEVPYIKDHVIKWNEVYNDNYPHRKFSVLAIDENATTFCIVRCIKPLEPPQINLEGFNVTPQQCATFVSLIPFSDCSQFYKNIWLSTDRFLKLMIGSIIDHAVALTCYFLALKMEAWLLLGFGIPNGFTGYVLVKEYDINQVSNFYLYDVVQGEKIYLNDVFCPLQKVYCLVNEHNIWGNIQKNDNVTTMRFDVNRRTDWLPVFNNKIKAPTNSIQGTVKYQQITIPTDDLEIMLERKIRKRIAKLRPMQHIKWDRYLSNEFKVLLCGLEKTKMFAQSNMDALEMIKRHSESHSIMGHIINLPFNDVSSLLSQITSYISHSQVDDNSKIALTIFVKVYTNQVLSVWVFLAVVKERDE